VVNNTPTITNAPSATYNLFANGSPTIITLAATDPDGDTLTWSYSAPDAVGKATIIQADNVFTITPLTDIADTSFTIDFEVTDGINISTASSTVNIDNRSPVIGIAPAATYALATDGSPTVITLAATDPDGGSITWTYANSGLTDQATVVQNSNEFTITPNSTPGAYADFTLTFTASDSIESTSTSPTTLSLTFILLADEWADTVLSIGTSSTNGLGNSTFIDRSTNAHTVNVTNTPIQTAFHPYLDNWSVDFNNDGYLSIPNSADFNLDQNVGFTIEFWIKPRAGSSFGTVFCYWHYPEGYRFDITQDATAMYWYMDTAGNQITFNTTPNQWHHIAIVGNGSGTTTGYLDGVSVGTTTRAYTNVTNGRIFNIGSVQPYGPLSYRHASNLSNFRFVNGSTVYSGNFTPPTEKLTAITNTKLLTCQSNRFIDNSSSAREISLVGTPKISAYNPFGQSEYAIGENKGSFYLDGTNTDQIYANDGLGGGSYTIEFWWYPTDLGRAHLLYDRAFRNNVLSLQTDYTGATSTVFYRDGGEASTTVNQSLTNQWNHIVVTRSSNYHYLYVNGVRYSFASVGGAVDSSGNLYVGCASSAGSGYEYNQGWISDFRVTASSLYSSTTITPPTAPVGNTNASLYLPMDNAGVFDKTGNNELKLYGNTQTSSVVTKYGSTSLKFDGTYDIIMLNPGNWRYGDYTLELWAYFNSVSGNIYLIDHGGGNNGQLQYYAGSFIVSNSSGSPIVSEGGSPLSSGQWYHFAVTREGSTVRLFRDGVLKSTGTNSETYSDVQMCIGNTLYNGINSFSAWFNGYMQDIQILKGVAKYTTNFTPPNRTQGRTYQATS
jgi:hypothetical protein